MAKKKTVRKTSAGGCLLEVCGIGSIFLAVLFPPMVIAGVVLLIIGAMMSFKKVCSDCGNPVDKTSKMCPTCSVVFGREKTAAPIRTSTPGQTICQICENLLRYNPKYSGITVPCKYCDEPVILN